MAPSVALPQYDAATGVLKGTIYVWTKNFTSGAGGSVCFGEFVWYVTNGGDLYMDSGSNGTCGGGAIDPSLKQPTHVPGPGVPRRWRGRDDYGYLTGPGATSWSPRRGCSGRRRRSLDTAEAILALLARDPDANAIYRSSPYEPSREYTVG
jgi:hypothetical protein